MLRPFDYLVPSSLPEAVSMLEAHPKGRVLAGGTALLAALERGQESAETLIDLRQLQSLHEITIGPGERLTIGALVTLWEIIDSEIVAGRAPVLAQTARLMATPQVRNLATIGGNIGSGLASADMVTTLLALDAGLLMAGPGGQRQVSLDDYLARTQSPPPAAAIISAVTIPLRDGPAVYQKIMTRKAADLSLANVAVRVRLEGGKISKVRIAAGGCDGRPARLPQAEAVLKGKRISLHSIAESAEKAAETARQTGDWRASERYRSRMTGLLTHRALTELLNLP